jgi:hypothetical protein
MDMAHKRFSRMGSPWPLVASFGVLIVYLPLVVRRYAWSDDYPFLTELDAETFLSRGRPVSGLVQFVGFHLVQDIEGLRYLRIVGLLGVCSLVCWIASYLIRLGLAPMTSTLLALSCGFLPTFHSSAAWATSFTSAWICLAGAVATTSWVDGISNRRTGQCSGAVLLMATALLSYPPAAMFCWAVIALRLAVERPPARIACRLVVHTGLLVGSGTVLSLIVLTVIGKISPAGSTSQFRFVDSIPSAIEKVGWFLTHPVLVAARPFVTWSPSPLEAATTALPVLVVIGFGSYLATTGQMSERLLLLVLLGTAFSLTFASHLVASDNQIEYRFMTGITVVAWVLLVLGTRSIILLLWGSRRGLRSLQTVGLLLLGAITSLTALEARNSIDRLMIGPSVSKESYLREQLINFEPTMHQRILVIFPEEWPSTPRLGVFSTVTDLSHPWVVEPHLRLILDEHGMDGWLPEIEVRSTSQPTDQGEFELDFRPYVTSLS